jgi:hypothetical protein
MTEGINSTWASDDVLYEAWHFRIRGSTYELYHKIMTIQSSVLVIVQSRDPSASLFRAAQVLFERSVPVKPDNFNTLLTRGRNVLVSGKPAIAVIIDSEMSLDLKPGDIPAKEVISTTQQSRSREYCDAFVRQ